MPARKPSEPKPPTFIAAPTPSLATDLLDKLVAFQRLREELIDTKLGPSPAVVAHVIEIGDALDGSYVDHSECPVFWNYVRKQLMAGKDEATWVVGRLVKSGAGYRLEPSTDREHAGITKVLVKVGA